MVKSFTLQGTTVVLRPLSVADADALALAAPQSRENYPFSFIPQGIVGAKEYIKKALDDREAGRRLPFTIVWHSNVVGSTSFMDLQTWGWPGNSTLQRADIPDVIEIGATWLAESAQRTRCNTEAKYLLLTHAFESWAVHRVCFRTDERNQRSRRAIERLGARFEGIRRADMPGADGTVRNSAYYSIIRAEWPEIKRQLAARLSG